MAKTCKESRAIGKITLLVIIACLCFVLSVASGYIVVYAIRQAKDSKIPEFVPVVLFLSGVGFSVGADSERKKCES